MKEPIHLSAESSLVGLAALTLGVADATLVATSRLGATGAFQFVPSRVWVVAPLCWIVTAFVLAVPSYATSRRRGAVLTVSAMLALFLAARFYTQSFGRIVLAAAVWILAAALVWFVSARWLAATKRMAALISVVMVAVLLIVLGASRESNVLPAAKASQGPDVVIAFLDTVHYDDVFPLGTSVDSRFQFLSQVASRGVVFDRAYTPSPWTLPAHFAAVTGVPAHRLGIGFDHQHYDGNSATLAEHFHRRGYRTAAVISNTFLNRGTGFTRGFETYEHADNALDVCRTAPGSLLDRWWPWFAASVCNWNAAEVTRRAMVHVRRDDGRPLFLLLNYMDAHDPYYVESGCEPSGEANRPPFEVAPKEYRRRYYASHLEAIGCIDHHLSELAAQLEQRKRSAIFVVVADHGEQFGDHGLVRHGNSLYDSLLHVPFMIEASAITPGHVSTPMSIEALPELILNIVDRGQIAVRPRSMVSSLVLPRAVGGKEEWSLIRASWHLIRSGDELQLFDLSTDRAEQRNLAATPVAAALIPKLSEELERERRTRVDARTKEFRSLGYVH